MEYLIVLHVVELVHAKQWWCSGTRNCHCHHSQFVENIKPFLLRNYEYNPPSRITSNLQQFMALLFVGCGHCYHYHYHLFTLT